LFNIIQEYWYSKLYKVVMDYFINKILMNLVWFFYLYI